MTFIIKLTLLIQYFIVLFYLGTIYFLFYRSEINKILSNNAIIPSE